MQTYTGAAYLKNFIHKIFLGPAGAKCNFNLVLINFNSNSYFSVIATFQIGLHVDDLHVLKSIKNTLKCGRISISVRCWPGLAWPGKPG